MSVPSRFASPVGLIIAAALTAPAASQYSSERISLYAQITPGQFDSSVRGGNDCWGYVSPSGREYALMGLDNRMAVVEITDPSNPVQIGFVSHSRSDWGDMKVYGHYAYVSNESGGGIDIVDLSQVDNGQVSLVRRMTTGGAWSTHNIALDVDSGFLYLCGSNISGGSLVAYDLNVNPTNPTLAGEIVGSYSHDAQVVTYDSGPYAGRQIAFSAAENKGVEIIDVTDKQNSFIVSRAIYPNVRYCHQAWTNPERTHLYINDEADESSGATPWTRTIIFNITDLDNPVYVGTATTGLPSIDHNLYWHEGFVYEANYTSGLRIFDATDPEELVEVGWFDTYPASNVPSFNGAWSVYPFFPSGTVIVSDINRGLFIFDASNAKEGTIRFTFPDGQPAVIDPTGSDPIRIVLEERSTLPMPGSAVLHYNTGSGFQSVGMVETSPNHYEAYFPATPCGDEIEYYLSAETIGGAEVRWPANAPIFTFTARSGSEMRPLFADTFEENSGWTVENQSLDSGAWERGTPVGGVINPPFPIVDADGSGKCYVTGIKPGIDVDGGPTRLISPPFDLAEVENPMLSVALWQYSSGSDTLRVEINDGNSADWTLLESVNRTYDWETREYILSDSITPTGRMRLRFSSADNPNDSTTESGVDAFALSSLACAPRLELAQPTLVAGAPADLSAAGASSGDRVYFVYSLAGPGSTFVSQLGVMLDVASPTLIGSDTADATGQAGLTVTVPGGTGGLEVWLQAAAYQRPSNVISAVVQ